MNRSMFAGLALATVLAVNAGSAQAAESAGVKACADQWDTMKAANKIPAGATWPVFEKDCLAKAAAAPAAPAMAPAAKMAAPAVGANLEQNRVKTCAGQWDQMKAANKIPAGLKWPVFWHDCDTKLKAAGQ